MSDVLCVTNRVLCRENFLVRIEKIAKARPKAIILREKDLREEEYLHLAKKVLKLCETYHTPCILHQFVDIARTLNHPNLHLPLSVLRTLSKEEKHKFTVLGTSCHSLNEAKEAEQLGCTYLIAGHIFETDCKKGVAGRGTGFLRNICESVSIPVYAIGGITPQKITEIKQTGSAGVCVMSSMMTCENPETYLGEF